jgi:5'-nucleotidase
MEEFTKSRRSFLKQSLLVGAGLATGLMPRLSFAKKQTVLTILHTNDTHSRLDPFPPNGPHAGKGGVAARKRLIDQIRKDNEHVLLFDAGDVFQGTPYFNFFKGALEMRAMTLLGYDAATMGNHDFDEGVDNFGKQLKHADFPFLVANYDFSETSLAGKVKAFEVFERAGLRIGVFGLGIDPKGLIPEGLFGKVKFSEPLTVAKQMVSDLRDNQCDLIIVLSHLGHAYQDGKMSDVRLASELEGIDLIIGGHTHTFLSTPKEIPGPMGKKTLVAQVGHSGLILGRIDLVVERKFRRKSWTSVNIGVGET